MGRFKTREKGAKYERQQIELSPSELQLFLEIMKESGSATKRGTVVHLLGLFEENRRLQARLTNLQTQLGGFKRFFGVDEEGKETQIVILF